MENLVPHFIELIRRASTDLPADMEAALRRGPRERRPGLGRPNHPGCHPGERANVPPGIDAHLPGHRHADLLRLLSHRLVHAGPEKADSRGGGRGDCPVLSATQLGGYADRQESRQQPGRRFSLLPLRRMGGGLSQGGFDAQGRRLRERRRAVQPARYAARRQSRSWRGCAARCWTPSSRRRAWAAHPP